MVGAKTGKIRLSMEYPARLQAGLEETGAERSNEGDIKSKSGFSYPENAALDSTLLTFLPSSTGVASSSGRGFTEP